MKIDLIATREKIRTDFDRCLEESNKIWHDVLNLIITLSSSALVLTIALAEKLFPGPTGAILFSPYLIMSWLLLSVSIIFGIIAQLNEAIFFSNQAKAAALSLNSMDKKIDQGVTEDEYTVKPDASGYIVYNGVFWGTVSINSFIFAIAFICLALLRKFFSNFICIFILIIFVIALVIINIYLLKKYYRK